jgi:predicted ATPase
MEDFPMRFVLRSDLGGRAAAVPAFADLAKTDIEKPVVVLAGGNGSGKSTLFAALRQATGLIGPGIGAFQDVTFHDRHIPLPEEWETRQTGRQPDLAKHLLFVEDRHASWSARDKGVLPEDAVGVLDPVSLGWRGQRVWLHDGRDLDNLDNRSLSGSMRRMRSAADDALRSHGQQMAGKLRYAVAWAIGLFDLRDGYDSTPPDRDDVHRRMEIVPRDVFTRLAGHAPGDGSRTDERWLLLDEPETGLDPEAFGRLMALLVSHAGHGRLRVFCATHSPLLFELANDPAVQIIDLDGYATRLNETGKLLATEKGRAALVAEEIEILTADCARSIGEDRGLTGQGRFTAHEAQGIYYADAVIPPYGKPNLLKLMRSAQASEETAPATRRR